MESPAAMMTENIETKLKNVCRDDLPVYLLKTPSGSLIPLAEAKDVAFQLGGFQCKEKPSDITADHEGGAADPHVKKLYESLGVHDEDPGVFQLKGNNAFPVNYDYPFAKKPYESLGKSGEDGFAVISPRVFQLKGNGAFPPAYYDPYACYDSYARKLYESFWKHGEDGMSGIYPQPHTCIDMPKEDVVPLIVQQNWHDYMQVKKNPDAIWDKSAIVQATLGITGQAIGAMLVHAFADPTAPSWAKYLVKATTVGGFGATVAGIGLRRLKGMLPSVMIKTGAIATASAIIVSLGLPLEPVVAWTVGPASLLLVGTAVALA